MAGRPRSVQILHAMRRDSGTQLRLLKVDGGMTANRLLLQLQSDLLGVPVGPCRAVGAIATATVLLLTGPRCVDVHAVRHAVPETTALGAAMAAGLAIGAWRSPDDAPVAQAHETFRPSIDDAERAMRLQHWQRAVERSLNWLPSAQAVEQPAGSGPTHGADPSHRLRTPADDPTRAPQTAVAAAPLLLLLLLGSIAAVMLLRTRSPAS